MRILKTLFCGFLWLWAASLWAESNPVPMLENAASQVLSTLKQNKSSLKQDHKIIYQAVERYLLPIVDVEGMSRSVLGRTAWNKASAKERQDFMHAFTQLVIRTYANPLAEYSDETVKFMPPRGQINGRFTRINSVIIRSNGHNISLNYSLVAKSNGWKVYDLSVEGISLLQSFRNQFGEILQSSSMQELIQQMQHKSKAA